jgi:integrase/recombinase XerD
MFNKIFKRAYTVKKHVHAPLLTERLKYLQYWNERTNSLNTLQSVAQYLLRIVDYLHLKKTGVVTIEQLESAADKWGRYQYNHPQKKAAFSKAGKERFIWYATNWLKKLNRLELSPEEKIPLFNKIFERHKALRRHTSAPLLEERLIYLQYLADNGAPINSLRRVSQYLLLIIDYLDLENKKNITHEEIKKAAKKWATFPQYKRKYGYSKFAAARFTCDAIQWLKMLGRLREADKEIYPFTAQLLQYVDYMRDEKGLSEHTIKAQFYLLRNFLKRIKSKCITLDKLNPVMIDELLIEKHDVNNYSRRSVQSYATVVRTFLRFSEYKSWCRVGISNSIKTPRVYSYESLPCSPSWDDVKKLLVTTEGDQPTNIRDRAILMLLSIYGLRCIEIVKLKLEDIDWKNEIIFLNRAKDSKPQKFPLSKIVGESILRYLKEARQNQCSLREVFLCRRSPFRALKSSTIFQIVNRRLKPLSLALNHHGPHSLRHACATHLINEGISLKEISDHLGHQGLETTRIYTKVDLTNLRKVADFDIGDLL